MKRKESFFLLCLCFVSSFAFTQTISESPDLKYGQLFVRVQRSAVFSDSKTFADAVPKYETVNILQDYEKLKDTSTTALKAFIFQHFSIPVDTFTYVSDSSSISEHITKLWDVLSRPANQRSQGSLIALPYSYIVPGGRFREMYYWDSYFTMLGLKADNKTEQIQQLVDNFSWMLDTYGFIPNGNRTYYLSRSQPPFYSWMIDLLSDTKGEKVYEKYLPQLLKEYSFWMNGVDSLSSSTSAYRRVIRLSNGSVLNRYWDDASTPRPESYREDLATAREAKLHGRIEKKKVYRDLRAAAESGWDFSSRWIAPDSMGIYSLYNICTTDIIPVDLNALLYHLELTIAKAYRLQNRTKEENDFLNKAANRKRALNDYCWNKEKRYFMDWNWRKKKYMPCLSLAGVYPLFCQMATDEQAYATAQKLEQLFLKPGGLVTALNASDQQWDAPNGWAPLQWMSIEGLRYYGENKRADEIKKRWMKVNEAVYHTTWKMLEKYNVEDLNLKSGGGEYPTQDGFGWTNGVYQQLAKEAD